MYSRLKHRALLPVLLLVVILLIVLLIIVSRFQVKTITVEGNYYYTDEEIQNLLFSDFLEKNTLYSWLKCRMGQEKNIPFIERYQMDIISPTEIEVIVYEKNIIGYIDYMGSKMYFDRDGVVVESSQKEMQGIPQILGVNFKQIILYQKLEVDQDQLFDGVLTLTQLLQKFELDVDTIHFDKSDQATIQIGDITVELGNLELLDGKISELNDILPNLEGKKGTLYLDTYKESSIKSTYIFKKAD